METPIVSLACAHPAKFAAAVTSATQQHPALPPHLADLLDREERVHRLPNDLSALQGFIRDNVQRG